MNDGNISIKIIVQFDRSNGKKLGVGFKNNKSGGGTGVYVSSIDPNEQAFGKIALHQKISHLNGQDVRASSRDDIKVMILSSDVVTLGFEVPMAQGVAALQGSLQSSTPVAMVAGPSTCVSNPVDTTEVTDGAPRRKREGSTPPLQSTTKVAKLLD